MRARKERKTLQQSAHKEMLTRKPKDIKTKKKDVRAGDEKSAWITEGERKQAERTLLKPYFCVGFFFFFMVIHPTSTVSYIHICRYKDIWKQTCTHTYIYMCSIKQRGEELVEKKKEYLCVCCALS